MLYQLIISPVWFQVMPSMTFMFQFRNLNVTESQTIQTEPVQATFTLQENWCQSN